LVEWHTAKGTRAKEKDENALMRDDG